MIFVLFAFCFVINCSCVKFCLESSSVHETFSFSGRNSRLREQRSINLKNRSKKKHYHPKLPTKGAVTLLQFFPSRMHRSDRLNVQQVILKIKPFLREKMLSMEILIAEYKSLYEKQTREYSIKESCSSIKASIQNLIQKFKGAVFQKDNFEICLREKNFRHFRPIRTPIPM